jgi:hypothetical protein
MQPREIVVVCAKTDVRDRQVERQSSFRLESKVGALEVPESLG